MRIYLSPCEFATFHIHPSFLISQISLKIYKTGVLLYLNCITYNRNWHSFWKLYFQYPLFSFLCYYCSLIRLYTGQSLYHVESGALCLHAGFTTQFLLLTHWGRVTHICVNKLTIIGSDNGLSPGRHQAIIWTSAEILLIGPLGTNFSEILIRIQTFEFKKIHLNTCILCRLRNGVHLSRPQCVNWYQQSSVS